MINRDNWLLTEKYLKQYSGKSADTSAATIERYEFALRHLLIWADELPFGEALEKKLPSFSSYVFSLPARRGEGLLAAESQKKIINTCKGFLSWVVSEKQEGYKNISMSKVNQLVPPRIQQSDEDPTYVELDEILQIASRDFAGNLALMRDQAAMCFAYISGARAGAIVTAPIHTIDIEKMEFRQYPKYRVHTKNGKSATTFFLPIDPLVAVVKRWDALVRSELPHTAPWYPILDSHWGEYKLTGKPAGENRVGDLGDQITRVYEKAGMGSLRKSPHAFRHGFAVYCLTRVNDMAEYQNVSRNLMHESISVTDKIYAARSRETIRKGIAQLVPDRQQEIQDDLNAYLDSLCRADRKRAMMILVNKLD